MGIPNPKNTGFASGDLGLAAILNPDLVDDLQEKKKKTLQASREAMGGDGSSVYGSAASALLGLTGAP